MKDQWFTLGKNVNKLNASGKLTDSKEGMLCFEQNQQIC